ncbi:MAG TPA: alpha/beta hydrolase-fold protein [Nitriliruptoraceae bacterium]|nr:alpha/beta hydrolase-fold protein [Nitriliruptoraceae bacterium]
MAGHRIDLPVEGHDASLSVIVHGHWGRPVIVFPSEAGHATDFESNGMVDAVRGLVDDGRVKLYCVDSADNFSWSDTSIPIEERALRHGAYTHWITSRLLPWIDQDSDGAEPLALGCSMGAYHAVQLVLQRPDLVPLAIGFSGNYDVEGWRSWGAPGDATYFANPMAHVANLHGDHLDWLRTHASFLLVVGEGAWEVDPTGSLPSTRAMADLMTAKGLRHELDVWGHDSAHDWPWWQRQLAHHLPRFC